MPTPEQNPTDPRPDQAAATPDQGSESDATVSTTPNLDTDTDTSANTASPGNAPSSTQQHMGDGAGIRGDYGDASQTNGLEGSPGTSDQPLTDTELTGS